MMIVLAFGNVEAVLDDRRRQQDVEPALDEAEHRPLELVLAHLPVPDRRSCASGTSRCSRLPIEKIDSTRLWTKYTCPPRASSLRMARSITGASNLTTLVWIDSRSFGGVSMIDMSRMPTSDMFSVRGIGVAVIVSTSTFLRICLMRSLCATPNRCSSSTTSRPRSLNDDVLRQQAVRADDDVDLAGGDAVENLLRSPASCGTG